MDERRRTHAEGAFEGPDAGHQGLEGDEAHGRRSPPQSRYPRRRPRPPPVSLIFRALLHSRPPAAWSTTPLPGLVLIYASGGGWEPKVSEHLRRIDRSALGATDALARRPRIEGLVAGLAPMVLNRFQVRSGAYQALVHASKTADLAILEAHPFCRLLQYFGAT